MDATAEMLLTCWVISGLAMAVVCLLYRLGRALLGAAKWLWTHRSGCQQKRSLEPGYSGVVDQKETRAVIICPRCNDPMTLAYDFENHVVYRCDECVIFSPREKPKGEARAG
jgi:hypothetical protein